jgi:hypothetical protein
MSVCFVGGGSLYRGKNIDGATDSSLTGMFDCGLLFLQRVAVMGEDDRLGGW